MTTKSNVEIAADFDAIAQALSRAPGRDALTRVEAALVKHVPATAKTALDVGCGDGAVARVLAGRGLRVTALDLAPEMIALAKARTPQTLDVRFDVADVMTASLGSEFDVVISINVVHHLPFRSIIPRLAALVSPAGVLLIQDVVARPGLRYLIPNLLGALSGGGTRLLKRLTVHRHVARLYEAHGTGEIYFTPEEAERAYGELLPGVRIQHHPEWRYSAIWKRPT